MKATQPRDIPSIDEIVARARELAPTIAERAVDTERARRVPTKTVEELVASGLTRLYTPRRWGGYANGFAPGVQAIIELSKPCASTGWVFGFFNFHSWVVALFPDQAQADVWGGGPDVFTATSFAPLSKSVPVDGGYRLTGKAPWASGIDHCKWIAAGALTPDPAGGPPSYRLYLVPREDFTVEDTWFNVGLRGSGSNTVVMDSVFVPSHRVLNFSDMFEGTGPGAEANEHPMFRSPLMLGAEGLLCAPLVGAAVGAYEEYRSWTRAKTATFGGQQVSGSADIQRRLSEAAADIEASRTVFEAAMARADAGGPVTLLDRARSRRDFAWVALTAQRGVDALMQAGGARVLFEGNPVQRAWRDVHSISVHMGLNPLTAGINFGRLELGLEPDPADPAR